MIELWTQIRDAVTVDQVLSMIRALVLVLGGFIVARLIGGAVWRILRRQVDVQRATLARKATHHLLLALFLVAALHQLGFNLGVLVGAAGVLSVAVGFASQTSASNVISGLFLIVERPFEIGDVITLGGTTGEVLSIDLLSVKLRTFDNLFVRIPNETIIKSEVRTLTRFPIRRIDVKVGVAYKEDLSRVRRVLFELADRNPLSLEEPKPLLQLVAFGDSSIDLQFSVWARRETFLELKYAIQEEIKTAFEREGIEIPFPHRSLYAGSATEPLPVRIVGSAGQAA